jgi:hypothetical protein
MINGCSQSISGHIVLKGTKIPVERLGVPNRIQVEKSPGRKFQSRLFLSGVLNSVIVKRTNRAIEKNILSPGRAEEILSADPAENTQASSMFPSRYI